MKDTAHISAIFTSLTEAIANQGVALIHQAQDHYYCQSNVITAKAA